MRLDVLKYKTPTVHRFEKTIAGINRAMILINNAVQLVTKSFCFLPMRIKKAPAVARATKFDFNII